jgi:hypothetical protein
MSVSTHCWTLGRSPCVSDSYPRRTISLAAFAPATHAERFRQALVVGRRPVDWNELEEWICEHLNEEAKPIRQWAGTGSQCLESRWASWSIRSRATRAQRAVSGSTWMTLTGVPAARFSSVQQRWGRSMRNMVTQVEGAGERR